MNRRKLFSFLPLVPVLVGAAVVKEAQADEKPLDNNDKTLRLMGKKKTPERSVFNDPSVFYIGGPFYTTDDTKHVTMAVGQDGNLWLQSAGGDWKRVVTE